MNKLLPIRWMLLAALLAAVTACGPQENEQIEWQLPLVAPPDPHGAQAAAELPQWAGEVEGKARFVLLQKSTTHLFDGEAEMNGTVTLQGWQIHLLGLAEGLRVKSGAFIEDRNVHNPAAFVELARDGNVVYRGWLYEDFPELFGPDLMDWKLWVKDISVRRPAEGGTDNNRHP